MNTPYPLPTIDEFLQINPLPPEFAHLEPAIRSPIGQSMVHSIIGAYDQGLRGDALMDVLNQVIEFYKHDTHRCNACLCWTKDFQAGAVVDDAFHMFVICARCQKLIAQGRATPTMRRNVQGFMNGGAR